MVEKNYTIMHLYCLKCKNASEFKNNTKKFFPYSPYCAFLLGIHFASNGAVEVLDELLAVGQAANDAVPSRRVSSSQDLRLQRLVLELEAPGLAETDPEHLPWRVRKPDDFWLLVVVSHPSH